ncbi:MAG: antirestriction protein ArdA, partial [Gammaproteobacteria bacterium]
ASALYSLASCGALDVDRLAVELHDSMSDVPEMEAAIRALGGYCGARCDRGELGPVQGWAESSAEVDRAEEDEHARSELVTRISVTSTRTLGEIAVVVTTEQVAEEADEVDTFSWADAARWSPDSHEDELAREATRVNRHEPGERESGEHIATSSGHSPEIWVGSLSDYSNGRLHGVWLDATLDPEQLRDAVQFMLRNSYERDAEAWAIMDYDDFCGLDLGEYESLEVVSRIAQGIDEHGEAFAKWVEYVGERSEEALGPV